MNYIQGDFESSTEAVTSMPTPGNGIPGPCSVKSQYQESHC